METEKAFELLGSYTADQWGMVTARQARELGVDAVSLHRLAKARFLDIVRRGVYASAGSAVSGAREEQAVWLALNPAVPGWERPMLDPAGGVVSHQSAARLHGLGELRNSRLTFTVPKRRDVRDPDVWTKKATLAESDVTVLDGLPVTTVLRTVCDLLDQHLDGSHIATIIREGVEAGKLQLDRVAEHIGPYARRYGARPNNGEELLENLLSQIGLTTATLTLRPTPPGTAADFATVAAAAKLANLVDLPAIRQLRDQASTIADAASIMKDPAAMKAAAMISALPPGMIEKMFANHAPYTAVMAAQEALRNAGVSPSTTALAALGSYETAVAPASQEDGFTARSRALDAQPSSARRNEPAKEDDVEA